MKVFHVFLLIFTIFTSIALAGGAARPKFNANEEVHNLTRDTYGNAIDYFDYSLILFYSPNASDFNKTNTEYLKAAEKASVQFPGIAFCRMDGDEFSDYTKMVGAKTLPAIKLFDQGQDDHRTYIGNGTAESILEWLKNQTESRIPELDDGEEIEDFVNATENVGLYIGSKSSEAYNVFLAVSTVFLDVEFIRSTNEDLKPDEDVGNDIFVLYRSFNKESSKYRGKFDFAALKNFTKRHKFQSVMTLDQKAFKRIFQDKETAIILLRNNTGEEHVKAQNQFVALGSQFRDKIALTVGGFQDPHGKGVANYFGITQNDLPTVIIMDYDNKMTKYRLDRDITTKNTKMFLLNFFHDNLLPYYRSAPIPSQENSYEGNVKIAVANTFQQIIFEADKHVMVEIYSPTCGRCLEFAPIYSSFASKVSEVDDLVVAKMDGSVNDAPGVAVEYYPFVLFYPKAAKDSPIEYTGDRTEEALLEFIQKHVTLPIVN